MPGVLRQLFRILRDRVSRQRLSADPRDQLGRRGEELAAKHLQSRGYSILGRNLRVPMGEADILARTPDRTTIVLVEVKTRRPARSGAAVPPPERSVHRVKRAKLSTILNHLARANRWPRQNLRIDVIAIDWPLDGEPALRHHENCVAVRRGRASR